MTGPPRDVRRPNPFSTRFIRPGAIAYQFAAGQSAQELVRRLADLHWQAQIVGPHGSGKSTLLASLVEPLLLADRRAFLLALHDAQRRLPAEWSQRAEQEKANLIVVDGYEQLSLWSRLALKSRCRRRGWGLLVTTHQDVGLPTLFRTETSLPLAERVVDQLVSAGDIALAREAVSRCFSASHGNLRDMLFALYDAYETESRSLEKPSVRSAGQNDCAV